MVCNHSGSWECIIIIFIIFSLFQNLRPLKVAASYNQCSSLNHDTDKVHRALPSYKFAPKRGTVSRQHCQDRAIPYLFWHSTLGRRGTTPRTGRWCICSRWWGCIQGRSRTPPPSRGCSARTAAGGRCSHRDSPLEVVDKLGQTNKQREKEEDVNASNPPLGSFRVSKCSRHTSGPLSAPCGSGYISVTDWDAQQAPIHTSGGMHMPGGHSGGIWEDSNPCGKRKTERDTCPPGGCMGMEQGSQNKENHAFHEAFIVQLWHAIFCLINIIKWLYAFIKFLLKISLPSAVLQEMQSTWCCLSMWSLYHCNFIKLSLKSAGGICVLLFLNSLTDLSGTTGGVRS